MFINSNHAVILNKEKIRIRLQKSASQLWGVQSGDLASYDPVVNLLFGAVSVELEKVYSEIYSSNARVLERLSTLLLPDVHKNTLPAHTIVYATPYDGSTIVSKTHQFYFSKKTQAKESSVRENFKDIFFSPVGDFRLLNAEIKFFGTNTGLYTVDNLLFKDKFANITRDKKATKFLWIGIKPNTEEWDTWNEINFYFDWLNNPLKDQHFDILPFAKWYMDDNPLHFDMGIHAIAPVAGVEQVFNYDVEFITSQNTLSYYKKRFISLKLPQSIDPKKPAMSLKSYPDEFKTLYNAEELLKQNEEMLWIKVVFPAFSADEVIDEMLCQMNCVPALNRKLCELTFRLNDSFNIIPMYDRNDDAAFLSVQSVKSNDGKPYISNKIEDINQLNSGSYVIRKGGVQRFDSRNAREYLQYMIELLRDECAAFAVYGQEMLASNITEINQKVTQIEQKIQRSNVDDEHTIDYLILKSFLNDDTVFIEYWSTLGDFANGIRVSTPLNVFSGNDINSATLAILSESTGGRDELTASEMLNSFKQSLGSRDRIVTVADIRNLCFSELGDQIKEVKVKKEYVVDNKSNTGFKRVINVQLIPTHAGTMSEEDMALNKLKLESHIQNNSFSNMPVQISFIN